jgi:hypothetical protein
VPASNETRFFVLVNPLPDLSVLIPARNEEWLKQTVEDVCRNKRGDTNVIVVLDGEWPMPGLMLDPSVDVVFHANAIGQRAATNLAARVSTAKYILKLDAHCAIAEGFDVELMRAAEILGSNVTQIPLQKRLHVYNQVCQGCGAVYDQAPQRIACPTCKNPSFRKELVWKPRPNGHSTNWVIDSELHFQYASAKGQVGDYPEVMSFLGACMFVERAHFLELGGFDESVGSWGQYAQEWACKEWLSGGRVVCNRLTWYAHFFRVGGIGFPYDIKAADQEYARQYSRKMWRGNNWPGQAQPLRWLVDKFWPVAGWTQEQRDALPNSLSGGSARVVEAQPVAASAPAVDREHGQQNRSRNDAGIVYYSDGRADEAILSACQSQLVRASNGLPISAVTLCAIPWEFSVKCDQAMVLNAGRSYLTMFRQILIGLERLTTEYAFLAEHDVIYSESHFQFRPPNDSTYFYDLNWWKVDAKTGHAVTYKAKQTSQLCANRQLLIEHYRKRIAIVERDGFSMKQGFEPGSHNRKERVDDVPSAVWRSAAPNIDIRHGSNLTPSRWKREQFRHACNCAEWQEADAVPGWGPTKGRFAQLLESLSQERRAYAS